MHTMNRLCYVHYDSHPDRNKLRSARESIDPIDRSGRPPGLNKFGRYLMERRKDMPLPHVGEEFGKHVFSVDAVMKTMLPRLDRG